MRSPRTLVLTPGDPEGIGPEITWKTIRSGFLSKAGARVLCIGARAPFDRLKAPVIEVSVDQLSELDRIIDPKRKAVYLFPAPEKAPGKRLHLPGFQAGWSIENATHLVLKGEAAALVTGPINKERLQKGGYNYSGHTDFLADLCGVPEVTMMLANEQLRITLVTVHIGLRQVPQALSRKKIRRTILHTVESLHNWWGIRKPRVAVTALNPHAGEGGIFGDEEIRIIEPEIQALQKAARGKYVLSGPHPADTLFAKHVAAPPKERYDAVVCMYHDQGLIPVKLLDFQKTVNVTLGLPIVRTSVDHGTAFDIAGKGIADPSSLQSAIELALRVLK